MLVFPLRPFLTSFYFPWQIFHWIFAIAFCGFLLLFDTASASNVAYEISFDKIIVDEQVSICQSV